MQSIQTTIIIISVLYLGCLLGKKCGLKVKEKALILISPTVYVLLFLMGLDSSWIFLDGKVSYSIMLESLALASFVSIFTVVFLVEIKAKKLVKNNSKRAILSAFYGCLKVVIAFCIGGVFYYLTGMKIEETGIAIDFTLYLLILLIGFDLSSFTLRGFAAYHLKIPLLTIGSTCVGALVFYSFSDRNLLEIMISVSGFGWFTFSGPMVTSSAGPELGIFAFLTDLFRELISIIFLYLLGSSCSKGAIGICGAAALDSALPFIKENCEAQYINHAIASGFILTVLAPILLNVLCDLLGHC